MQNQGKFVTLRLIQISKRKKKKKEKKSTACMWEQRKTLTIEWNRKAWDIKYETLQQDWGKHVDYNSTFSPSNYVCVNSFCWM